MSAPALFDLPVPASARSAAVPATFLRSGITVLSYGLGADSTAILLMFLAAPERYGLARDLSDLVVVHAVTGDEWPDSLSYVDRLVLPLLRRAGVRLVQIARGGPEDADGVVILDDSRQPRRIFSQGPWRLSDELRAAGTVPQMANGRRTCSIKFKGWCLDAWAAHEFGTSSFRRVIGYHAGEMGRAEKDTSIQRRLNAEAGRSICEPHYPLIVAKMDRAAVEAYVLAQLGEPIRKSYCAQCPFSGVCASRDAHEDRLRAHPHVAADVLRMEYVSQALNERVALYGTTSLRKRLTNDGQNTAVLDAFALSLDQAPHAVYEVRRIYFTARTDDCRQWHGGNCRTPRWWCRQPRTEKCVQGHPAGRFEPWCSGYWDSCRGQAKKGQAWRSVRTVFEGTRQAAETYVRAMAVAYDMRLERGEHSGIERAHYLTEGDSYPTASAYLVAAPAGVHDKQRPRFEERFTQLTGRDGTRGTPVRELPEPGPKRRTGGTVLIRRAKTIGGVTLIA
ncbi:hypothetical protein [Streptomyces stelliscabiei]|uniref:hypothetical protein n=1 Tax=Streptomyces stelliscabiei TaxID=146820 RepID=UPI0029A77B28|nr:hypothetical protein [Streptomyces stelliscabiei]MDX2554716.1 hypothetical protein [Streptomyces stelliscabiei]MDX2613243.1 hypothetical protein [Streptomyces stelliscabiei]MDX2638481.1 hypothetical protein [Streptomyces stelliscabiei]MDX2661633.1 hypothetical protein [Streptomyces stelliscabiei]MDX2712234.1 hypothetical protein [Streptomyces stelliscabiei]